MARRVEGRMPWWRSSVSTMTLAGLEVADSQVPRRPRIPRSRRSVFRRSDPRRSDTTSGRNAAPVSGLFGHSSTRASYEPTNQVKIVARFDALAEPRIRPTWEEGTVSTPTPRHGDVLREQRQEPVAVPEFDLVAEFVDGWSPGPRPILAYVDDDTCWCAPTSAADR